MTADIAEYVASLKASAKFGPQVVCHKIQTEEAGSYAAQFPQLAAPLRECLGQSGIERLYTHQCRAISGILEGRDTLVATPTASGKSMIYNLPVLNDLFQQSPGYSLYLFPLKALAQDQYKVLNNLFTRLPAEVCRKHPQFAVLFDGDT
jgi:DEAD/DEAH box helicase domain-containing protein